MPTRSNTPPGLPEAHRTIRLAHHDQPKHTLDDIIRQCLVPQKCLENLVVGAEVFLDNEAQNLHVAIVTKHVGLPVLLENVLCNAPLIDPMRTNGLRECYNLLLHLLGKALVEMAVEHDVRQRHHRSAAARTGNQFPLHGDGHLKTRLHLALGSPVTLVSAKVADLLWALIRPVSGLVAVKAGIGTSASDSSHSVRLVAKLVAQFKSKSNKGQSLHIRFIKFPAAISDRVKNLFLQFRHRRVLKVIPILTRDTRPV